MLVESLVKAPVELRGFRVLRVTGDIAGLVVELAPDWRGRHVVANAESGAGIGTRGGSGTLAMSRCGGFA